MKGLYPLLWRWHFIVGLLTAPVLIIVSITGALYAFEPQLKPLVEPYQTHAPCADCKRLAYAELASIVRERYPKRTVHELAEPGPGRSVQAELEDPDGQQPPITVFLNPFNGKILHERITDAGVFGVLLGIHRRLLGGEPGRYIVELTVSWVFVTLLLGLLLWWPRRTRGPGSWWPRLRAPGRMFWRDLHSVTGFYLLPLALLLGFTGLFFSPLTEKSVLGGMYLTDQLPSLFLDPPELAEQPPEGAKRMPIDALIDDFVERGNVERFDIHLPSAPKEPAELSTHLGHEVWRLRQSYYNPYTGELLGEIAWDNLAPGAKALMLFFPLHTGNILGLGTQILASLASLLLAGITVAGIVMWWRRRKPGRLGLPSLPNDRRRLPPMVWATLLLLAIVLPAFGISLVCLFVGDGIRRLIKRRRASPPADRAGDNA